ncbi:terminase large subunit [Rhodovulum sp. DZ06]|uniref:terminase large subunit n=1 Tax=Rhodovulum sp. DZ06 TaxID=3425126 RepID=UPI003D355DD7
MGQRGPGADRLKRARRSFAGDGADADQPIDLFAFHQRARREPWDDPELSRAGRVIAFLECLPVTTGLLAGEPFSVRAWQREIIEDLYATDDQGGRPVRQSVITLPRGNGKTGLAAGLCLAHLCGPEAEARGQCFSAASDKDQAGIIFREMEAMILQTPFLAQRLNIKRHEKRIEDMPTGSTYTALSADARKAHGLNVSFFIYDEIAQAPNRNLYDYLVTGMGKRKEPLGIVISTQSSNPLHVMSELVDYGEQVRDGVIEDPTFLPVIYAAPADADVWDEATWYACNPALGDFRSLEEMQQTAARARRIPTLEAAFRNLYLNQRIDPDERFITVAEWDRGAEAPDLARLAGRKCFGGLDLGSTRDLTALVLVFPPEREGEPTDVLAWFWCPAEALAEREERDRVPYLTWASQGLIEPTPGAATDYTYVVHRLGELAATYDIEAVAYDRWRIEELKRILADEGVEVPLVQFGQGFKDMAPAIDSLERAIADGKLRHGAHPILKWNATNAVVVSDPAGNRKLDKVKSRERIDGVIALVMALGAMAKDAPDASPWCLSNGPLFLEL